MCRSVLLQVSLDGLTFIGSNVSLQIDDCKVGMHILSLRLAVLTGEKGNVRSFNWAGHVTVCFFLKLLFHTDHFQCHTHWLLPWAWAESNCPQWRRLGSQRKPRASSVPLLRRWPKDLWVYVITCVMMCESMWSWCVSSCDAWWCISPFDHV